MGFFFGLAAPFVCLRVDVVLIRSLECYYLFGLSRSVDTNLQRAAARAERILVFSFSPFLLFCFPFKCFIFIFIFFGGGDSPAIHCPTNIAKHHSNGQHKQTGMQDQLGIISKDLVWFPNYPVWDSGRSGMGMDSLRLS